jgi:hypothetical protein
MQRGRSARYTSLAFTTKGSGHATALQRPGAMKIRLLVAVALFGLAGCESWTSCERFPGRCPDYGLFHTVSAKTSGVSGPVAWALLETRAGGDTNLSWYSFVLVLTEHNGSAITFTSIYRQVWGQGAKVVQDAGSWRLPANGELRLPMAVVRTCRPATCSFAYPPYWNVILTGKDAGQGDVRVQIEVAVPLVSRVEGNAPDFDVCPRVPGPATPFGVELGCFPKRIDQR